MLRGLYAITDPHLTPTATLLHQVQAAVRGGAQVIQYRDKSSPAPLRLQMAQGSQDKFCVRSALFIL